MQTACVVQAALGSWRSCCETSCRQLAAFYGSVLLSLSTQLLCGLRWLYPHFNAEVNARPLALQRVKDPEKAAELRAQLQRLDQQLAADAAAQRKTQLVGGINVKAAPRSCFILMF